jgi:hypothetical protein
VTANKRQIEFASIAGGPQTKGQIMASYCGFIGGGPYRDRTCDLGIKSPLLYLLS